MSSIHAVVVANGELPGHKLLKDAVAAASLVIAADGGSNHCFYHNIVPDIIIGDLDSARVPEGYNGEVILDPDQETNDLEKALYLCLLRNVNSVDILGATGNRTDHTLKNLSVLMRFYRKFSSIRILDESGYMVLVDQSFTFDVSVGTQVSLVPMNGRVDGITTHGLKWSLNGEALENGVRDGTSNEAVSTRVSISVKNGFLLVIVNDRIQLRNS